MPHWKNICNKIHPKLYIASMEGIDPNTPDSDQLFAVLEYSTWLAMGSLTLTPYKKPRHWTKVREWVLAEWPEFPKPANWREKLKESSLLNRDFSLVHIGKFLAKIAPKQSTYSEANR